MTYQGRIKDGRLVLDEKVALPEGCRVECVVLRMDIPENPDTEATPRFARLLKFAGKAETLSEDASKEHDHYLYGTPKG